MDSIVIEGRLIQVLTAQEGQSTRGAWKKQDFVIETSVYNIETNTTFFIPQIYETYPKPLL